MKRILVIGFSLFAMTTISAQEKFNLLVGTYTNTCASDGMYIYQFDATNGNFILKGQSDKVINPSYLSVSADNKFVYTVNENGRASYTSAFKYDAKEAKFKFLNKSESLGANPCHLVNDQHNVIIANYSGGSIAVYKKQADGSLSSVQQFIQNEGKGVNEVRQEMAHVHMVSFSPDRKFVLFNDLGLDKIFIYSYNPTSDKEVLKLKESVAVKPGSGPRHLTFSKDGKFVYLLHELDATLTTFKYHADGNLEKIAETSILPKDFKGATSAAAIKISKDGKFLYVTDRGDVNAITVFEIKSDGNLAYVEQVKTQGRGPRDFEMDPSGNYLLVAHQYTNNIVIFKRDKVTGKLTPTANEIELCSPVNLVFTTLK